MNNIIECSIIGCPRPLHCKGLCNAHYYRQRKGLPLDAPMRPLKRRKLGREPALSSKEASLRYYHKWRNAVVERLGGKCSHCGYDENVLGLDIDHINNDGKIDRKGKSTSGSRFRRMLENDCVGLQILCGTCHHIKTRSEQIKNTKITI